MTGPASEPNGFDQDRAAGLEGVARWRIVYHYPTEHTDGRTLDRTETIAWFHTTDTTAWADAAAFLPPTGYPSPHAVTVEQGTFTPSPNGRHAWQPLGPVHVAQVTPDGLTITNRSRQPAPADATAGQQNLFATGGADR